MTAAPPPMPGAPADAAHVLVVDDDARLRMLLRRYLGDNGFVVGAAADAAGARARLDALIFDVMVLDAMMPGESGVAFARALRGVSDLPILMLTAMDTPEARVAGLESGVDDYLCKPFEPRELMLRLRAILRRSGAARRGVQFGDCVFDPARGALSRAGAPVSLSFAEAALLRALAARRGEPAPRGALSRAARVAERSIDVAVNRLRRKLEPDPREPRYLATVRGVGYVLRAD